MSCRAALGVRLEAADEMVQRAERAHPAAERAAHEDREQQEGQGPEEVAIEGAGGKGSGEGDERIGFEEPADRPRDADIERRRPDRAGELGADQQEDEEGEEEDLRRQTEAAQGSVPHVGAHHTAGRGPVSRLAESSFSEPVRVRRICIRPPVNRGIWPKTGPFAAQAAGAPLAVPWVSSLEEVPAWPNPVPTCCEGFSAGFSRFADAASCSIRIWRTSTRSTSRS